MLDLIYTDRGWAVDLSRTPEAAEIARLFGTTTLPLPLSAHVTADSARAFAEQTAFGLEYGVAGGLYVTAGSY